MTTGKKGSGAVVAKPLLLGIVWALPSMIPPKGVAVINSGILDVGRIICGTGVGATFTMFTLTVRYRYPPLFENIDKRKI